MIILDYKDRRPLYEQIVDKISEMIFEGILKPDEKIPSVRNLAMELSINPNTIQRAYVELEHLGFLYSVKGKGNFVCDNKELVQKKKEEILKKLRADVIEAKVHGLNREEVDQILTGVYEGGEKDD